jgi:hypothetical protein
MTVIPQRAPVGDPFHGYLIQAGAEQALAADSLLQAAVIAAGDFTVRYGLRFLGKLHISIVPGLVVMDYGDMLTGEEAWTFLMTRSNLYPRSEVVGYRNDGEEDIVFIRALDLAVPPEVLVYDSENAAGPIARPTALIASDTAHLPARLVKFLQVYPSVSTWQSVAHE